MKTVCAWCARVLDDGGPGDAPGPISHGICGDCVAALAVRPPRDLKAFLDRFPEPVLCVGGDVDLVAANTAAERLVGRPLAGAGGTLGGDLLECARARLPGGCGTTVHCAACTLRRTVREVHATGRPQARVPAWIEREGGGRLALLVSATKAGGVVVLRVDRAADGAGRGSADGTGRGPADSADDGSPPASGAG